MPAPIHSVITLSMITLGIFLVITLLLQNLVKRSIECKKYTSPNIFKSIAMTSLNLVASGNDMTGVGGVVLYLLHVSHSADTLSTI